MFDVNSEYMYRVNLSNKSITEMKKLPDGASPLFTATSLDQYIYIFGWLSDERPTYRIKHSGITATWDRMRDWPADHGRTPNAVASPNAIFLVSGEPSITKTVSKYEPSLDQWKRLKDKPTGTRGSRYLCSSDFLYCIGGFDEAYNITRVAERMDLITMEWSRIANLNLQGYVSSAVEYMKKIYVFVRDRQKNRLSAASWDPEADQWTEFQLIDSYNMPDRRSRLLKNPLVIGGSLYLLNGTDILRYDVENNKLIIVMSFTDINMQDAVLVNTVM